jgi:hypothetical protein
LLRGLNHAHHRHDGRPGWRGKGEGEGNG